MCGAEDGEHYHSERRCCRCPVAGCECDAHCVHNGGMPGSPWVVRNDSAPPVAWLGQAIQATDILQKKVKKNCSEATG